MTISFQGNHRNRFRADLLAHRERSTLSDAEYAEQILKVSLNTYKKCVEQNKRDALTLKRHTIISILSNAELEPRRYGLAIGLPSKRSQYGGYQPADFKFLCGKYFLYRRSFLTARDITRSVLEIAPSQTKECLEFDEFHYYVPETGIREEYHYEGDIYLNRECNLLSMPAFIDGHVRLTVLHMPERVTGSRSIKLRGAVLTFGIPKGYWQPTVSCVFAVGPIEAKHANRKDLCKTIMLGTEEHSALSVELERIEEHATIMTPLMWFRGRG